MPRHRIIFALITVLMLAGAVPSVLAHCQIPCGIYDDAARFAQMREHVTTLEKSMQQIDHLAGDPAESNQLVRWVMNKEDHADQLADIITFYFMAQRIKPAAQEASEHAAYVERLTLLHRMLVQAMKAKQTTDLDHCQQLRTLIDEFERSYLGE
jgi:nickel superoxide dismutase